MPRSRVAFVGLFVVALVGIILFRAHKQSSTPEEPHSHPADSAVASVAKAPPEISAAPATAASDLLPDGQKVPELPADAPKTVSFGVILFTYRGAEGAPTDARDKGRALAEAKALLPDAQKDFDEAVKKGDPGSTARAGSMPRDVLEPALEYVLFTLKKGEVYGEPIDTPRGYWIVRRTN